MRYALPDDGVNFMLFFVVGMIQYVLSGSSTIMSKEKLSVLVRRMNVLSREINDTCTNKLFFWIAMVENTCNIQKGRDLNPTWLPLLRHFSQTVFLGPGTGTAWWGWFFRGAMIAERMLFRDGHCHVRFFISWCFQHAFAIFSDDLVSAALWFFDSLIFCSGALIGYISSIRCFLFLLFYQLGGAGAGALTSPFFISSEMRFLLRQLCDLT